MKMIKYILCFLLISSCIKDNVAKGYVVDTENNPVEGVKVLVNSSDIYTLTDAEGYFEIDPNGISNELLFDHPDYQLKFLNIKSLETETKVILAEKPIMLNSTE